MPEFSVATSLKLAARTYAFMLLRIAVYFGIFAAIVVAVGAGAGIGQAVGSLGGPAGRAPGVFWGSLAGAACIAVIVWWLREYLLYLVKAAHLAAMVLALDGKALALGPRQVAQAADLVQRRFRNAATLLQLERLVDGALASVIADFPLPAGFTRTAEPHTPVSRAIHFALGFLPEIILAAPIRNTKRGVWPEIRDALILFAQNAGSMMRSAFLLAAAAYAICLAVFLLALIPASLLAGTSFLIAALLAAAFAWSFKRALVDPFLVASMLQTFFEAMKDRQPDPAWDVKMTETSEAFREIKARSMQIARGSSQF